MNQHKISLNNVYEASLTLMSFTQEFEIIYCQRLLTRIHFVWPCMHLLVHLPREVLHLGPPVYSLQWTLEHTIENLGKEIKQHSNPFMNLSQCGIRCAQVNALKALIPDLKPDRMDNNDLSHGSRDLGDGFVLLRAREGELHPLWDCEADALRNFLPNSHLDAEICVWQWVKLQILIGQNCYSAWKEKQKLLEKCRTARNVKVYSPFYNCLNFSLIYFQILLDNEIHLAEVYFFIHLTHKGHNLALALVSLYSTPNPKLLEVSHNTLWLCEYQGDLSLKFINVKSI